MLIGFDGSRAFNKDKTGTENYSYQLLLHLSKIDTENSYLIYIKPSLKINKKDWPENFQFKVINFPRLWTQVGLALQTLMDPLDILFIPSHTLPILRKPGLKTVITVHDLGAEYLPQMHQLKQRLYLNFMTHQQLQSATKIIAVSKATKEDIKRRVPEVCPEDIEVIYEGVNPNLKALSEKETEKKLKEFNLTKENYFLFVGTIQPRKNLERLIEGYDSFYGPFNSSPKLVLAGGKGWLSDKIYSLVNLLDLDSKVKFLGRVDDIQLAALYSGAIGLVFPSLFEGFGLPILEAYGCDCPVVTSKVSSMPEVAGPAAILVDPFDINSIGYGMDKLLIREKKETKDYSESVNFKINHKKRAELIKEGREQLKKFSWAKAATETKALFESIKL